MTPGAQGSGSMTPGAQGSGSMTPGAQGSGSMTPGAQGSGSMTPGEQGSGSMTPGSGTNSTMDPAAYQQQMMAGSGQGSQPPGTVPSGSGSSAAMAGSGTSGTMPAGSSGSGGYPPGGQAAFLEQHYPGHDAGARRAAATPGGPSPAVPQAEHLSRRYDAGIQSARLLPGFRFADALWDGGQPGGDPSNPGYPGSGNMPGQQPAKPVTLLDIADLSFRYGRDQDAINCLYGHAVISDAEAAKEVLDKMGWITPLKRPAMTVRWGIAVEYVAPRGYNGSVYPIGTTQNLPVKGAPGGPAGGGPPPMGCRMAWAKGHGRRPRQPPAATADRRVGAEGRGAASGADGTRRFRSSDGFAWQSSRSGAGAWVPVAWVPAEACRATRLRGAGVT